MFEKQQSQVRATLVFESMCPSDGKNDWKIQHGSGVVDKEISVLFVMDTDCELKKKVNNRC